jgi:protein phosphatase 1G
MFEFCLAPDTTGDGTGCDNMTCVIVTFNGLSTHASKRTATNKRKAEDVTSDNADSSNADESAESAQKRLKDDN